MIGIGENHSHVNSTNFIIKNLPYLWQKGIDAIFLEGIPYEAQEMLDAYLESNSKEPPIELQKILTFNDPNNKKFDLIQAIKESNLKFRVIGLDTQSTYMADESHGSDVSLRVKAFNHCALEVINNTKKNKGLFLVGSDHLKYDKEGTPGISKLLDCPGIVITDDFRDTESEAYVVSGGKIDSVHKLHQYLLKHAESGLSFSPIQCDFLIEAPKNADLKIETTVYSYAAIARALSDSDSKNFVSTSIVKIEEELDDKTKPLTYPTTLDSNYHHISMLIHYPETKLRELDEKLNMVCNEFMIEEKKKSSFERSRNLGSVSSYKLNDLLNDAELGIAYTALLLNKYPNVLSIRSWADVAKISFSHAKLILSNKNITDKICEKGFLSDIGTDRPEHAKLILDKFSDSLEDDQRKMLEYFSNVTLPSSSYRP